MYRYYNLVVKYSLINKIYTISFILVYNNVIRDISTYISNRLKSMSLNQYLKIKMI